MLSIEKKSNVGEYEAVSQQNITQEVGRMYASKYQQIPEPEVAQSVTTPKLK